MTSRREGELPGLKIPPYMDDIDAPMRGAVENEFPLTPIYGCFFLNGSFGERELENPKRKVKVLANRAREYFP